MKFKPLYLILVLIIIVGVILFNSFNTIQSDDEKVTASWSEVINQYQRRADLVPNLVNTVKGYTNHEKSVLIDVTEARAKVGAIQVSADQLTDPAVMAKFQQAQQQLSSSLSRLLAVSENYPDLKASSLYSDLMVQLEGCENRIAVARGRYIQAIQNYNSYIRRLPGNLIANYYQLAPKAQFTVENEKQISIAPSVNFN
ncbi:LemA family protein [Orbus wheelerorum]|uniref:LemA family protein n=1 Tax=Orbus wheelerorum TaxID=3074111 RepID=UPI00370D091A